MSTGDDDCQDEITGGNAMTSGGPKPDAREDSQQPFRKLGNHWELPVSVDLA